VVNSQFSNQQWGLIMTAVEFEIDSPEQPDEASLVANTDQLDQILPELDEIDRGMGGAAGGRGGGGSSSGGIIDAIGKLGPGVGGDDGGVDDDRKAAAVALTGEYATQLQAHLEKQGRWADICAGAAAADETEE